MGQSRQVARILGLLTAAYGGLLFAYGLASAAVICSNLAAGLLLLCSSMLPATTPRARYIVVAGFFLFSVVEETILVLTFFERGEWLIIFVSSLLVLSGAAAGIWSLRRARRRKLSPEQAYFRN